MKPHRLSVVTPAARILPRHPLPGWARGTVGMAACLLAAQAVGSAVPPTVLPRASAILARAVALTGSGRFRADLAATIAVWALGMSLTIAIAVPAALLLGTFPAIRHATGAVVECLRPVPPVALVLLATLLLGPGLRMTLTLVVYGSIWPVLYNTLGGLDSADPVALDTLRSFGFGSWGLARHVLVPSALPSMFTGIRIASSAALSIAIAAGYITGRINGPGLGAFMADASSSTGSTTLTLASTFWAGLLGLALDRVLERASAHLLPWHVPGRQGR